MSNWQLQLDGSSALVLINKVTLFWLFAWLTGKLSQAILPCNEHQQCKTREANRSTTQCTSPVVGTLVYARDGMSAETIEITWTQCLRKTVCFTWECELCLTFEYSDVGDDSWPVLSLSEPLSASGLSPLTHYTAATDNLQTLWHYVLTRQICQSAHCSCLPKAVHCTTLTVAKTLTFWTESWHTSYSWMEAATVQTQSQHLLYNA